MGWGLSVCLRDETIRLHLHTGFGRRSSDCCFARQQVTNSSMSSCEAHYCTLLYSYQYDLHTIAHYCKCLVFALCTLRPCNRCLTRKKYTHTSNIHTTSDPQDMSAHNQQPKRHLEKTEDAWLFPSQHTTTISDPDTSTSRPSSS